MHPGAARYRQVHAVDVGSLRAAQERDRIGHILFTEAAEWMASTSNEDVFSFENISETLDINPAYFRRGVAAWHKRLLDAHRRAVEMPAVESPEPVRVAG